MSADRRCSTCARFVRVHEVTDTNGEVRRVGECLLGVWSPPIFETNTCSQYVQRGTFSASTDKRKPSRLRTVRSSRASNNDARNDTCDDTLDVTLPEELLDMDMDEFRAVLRDVIQDELGITNVDLGGRWSGGEVVLKPGKEGTAEKRIPIEAFFKKVVGIRDKLRVLEQRVNSHSKLTDEDKVQLQQYITQCYGSLTTFNILFADRADGFAGQKGDKDD